MPVPLRADHVLLGQPFATRDEVIRAIGEVMAAAGEVTSRYTEGMLRKEEQGGTWITDGVALPHGTNDVKGEILRSSVVLVQLARAVEWGNGKPVRLAIGLAGKGDEEHLKLLAGLAMVLSERDKVETLMTSADPNEVIALLAGEERV